VWGEGGGHQRGKRHWERLLEGRRRSSWRETHARGTTGEKLTGKPARETKLRLPIKAIAGFLKSWRPQPKATHSFPPNKESSSTAGQLFHPPLFAPLVLEPNLNNPHWETRVLRQCLTDMSRWLWSLVKGQLEDLELLGLDSGARTSSLCPPWTVLPLVTLGRIVLRVPVDRTWAFSTIRSDKKKSQLVIMVVYGSSQNCCCRPRGANWGLISSVAQLRANFYYSAQFLPWANGG